MRASTAAALVGAAVLSTLFFRVPSACGCAGSAIDAEEAALAAGLGDARRAG